VGNFCGNFCFVHGVRLHDLQGNFIANFQPAAVPGALVFGFHAFQNRFDRKNEIFLLKIFQIAGCLDFFLLILREVGHRMTAAYRCYRENARLFHSGGGNQFAVAVNFKRFHCLSPF
jgi:hypothetical protein